MSFSRLIKWPQACEWKGAPHPDEAQEQDKAAPDSAGASTSDPRQDSSTHVASPPSRATADAARASAFGGQREPVPQQARHLVAEDVGSLQVCV